MDPYVTGNLVGGAIWAAIAFFIARRVARAPTRSNTIGGLVIAGLIALGLIVRFGVLGIVGSLLLWAGLGIGAVLGGRDRERDGG